MPIDDMVRDEKLECDINKEAAKMSALLSGKIDKCEHLKGEDILPSNQRQVVEQATFEYSLFGNVFQKQAKTIHDQGKNISANRKNFLIFFLIKKQNFLNQYFFIYFSDNIYLINSWINSYIYIYIKYIQKKLKNYKN